MSDSETTTKHDSFRLHLPGLLSGTVNGSVNAGYGLTGGSKVPAFIVYGELTLSGVAGGSPQPVTPGGPVNTATSFSQVGTLGATVNVAPVGNWLVIQLGIFGGFAHSRTDVRTPAGPATPQDQTQGNIGGGAGVVIRLP